MNLRQKVKKAKRELAALEKQLSLDRLGQLGYMQMHYRMWDLKELIAFKQKDCRQLQTFEESKKFEVDWNKITYIAIYAEHNRLYEFKFANGRYIPQEVIDFIVVNAIKKPIKRYADKVAVSPKSDLDPIYDKVDYRIGFSSDRTKSKRIYFKSLMHQIRGEDDFYAGELASRYFDFKD